MSKLRELWKKALGRTIDEMTEEDLKELEKEKTRDAENDINGRLDKLEKSIDALAESDKKLHESMDCFMKKTKDAEEEEAAAAAKKKAEEEETEKESKDKKTKDSIARAEILVPGYTVDAKKPIDAVQREVLAAAYKTEEGKQAIEHFTGPNPNFEKLPAHTVDAAFIGASVLVGQKNNRSFQRTGIGAVINPSVTPKDMNKQNREFWGSPK